MNIRLRHNLPIERIVVTAFFVVEIFLVVVLAVALSGAPSNSTGKIAHVQRHNAPVLTQLELEDLTGQHFHAVAKCSAFASTSTPYLRPFTVPGECLAPDGTIIHAPKEK